MEKEKKEADFEKACEKSLKTGEYIPFLVRKGGALGTRFLAIKVTDDAEMLPLRTISIVCFSI